jgi:hypothetical protein
MKKATLSTIYSALLDSGYESTDPIMEEISKELNRGEAEKAKNAEGYKVLHDIVMNALSVTAGAVTLAELWESIEDEATEKGFTKGKVQHGLTKLWGDEIVKIEGNPNTYRKA